MIIKINKFRLYLWGSLVITVLLAVMLFFQLLVGFVYYMTEGTLIIPSIYFFSTFIFFLFFLMLIVWMASASFHLFIDSKGIRTLEGKYDNELGLLSSLDPLKRTNRTIEWNNLSSVNRFPLLPFLIIKGKIKMKDGIKANSWDRQSILFPRLPYMKTPQDVLVLLKGIPDADKLLVSLEMPHSKSPSALEKGEK